MKAIGFGRNVTGGGKNPQRIEVRSGDNKGAGTLAAAIQAVNEAEPGTPHEIVIQTNIARNKEDLVVRARNLTLRAEGGAVLTMNHLVFDCTRADNILLKDLRFEPAVDGKEKPRDSISIDGTEGRGEIGLWIDHCSFEAFYDLSVTANTRDKKGAPPLLLTISHCLFHDNDPDGEAHRNHGALGIHGSGKKNNPKGPDQATNIYATVCRNFFDHTRRRSPRSSNLTFVHAFNNVLENWGTSNPGDKADQENGMSAGHFGILAVEANYFAAGALKATIEIAKKDLPRLLVGTGDFKNLYRKGALAAKDLGDPIDILEEYRAGLRDRKAKIPDREPMTEALSKIIKAEAGAGKSR
jgi:pectate lyase